MSLVKVARLPPGSKAHNQPTDTNVSEKTSTITPRDKHVQYKVIKVPSRPLVDNNPNNEAGSDDEDAFNLLQNIKKKAHEKAAEKAKVVKLPTEVKQRHLTETKTGEDTLKTFRKTDPEPDIKVIRKPTQRTPKPPKEENKEDSKNKKQHPDENISHKPKIVRVKTDVKPKHVEEAESNNENDELKTYRNAEPEPYVRVVRKPTQRTPRPPKEENESDYKNKLNHDAEDISHKPKVVKVKTDIIPKRVEETEINFESNDRGVRKTQKDLPEVKVVRKPNQPLQKIANETNVSGENGNVTDNNLRHGGKTFRTEAGVHPDVTVVKRPAVLPPKPAVLPPKPSKDKHGPDQKKEKRTDDSNPIPKVVRVKSSPLNRKQRIHENETTDKPTTGVDLSNQSEKWAEKVKTKLVNRDLNQTYTVVRVKTDVNLEKGNKKDEAQIPRHTHIEAGVKVIRKPNQPLPEMPISSDKIQTILKEKENTVQKNRVVRIQTELTPMLDERKLRNKVESPRRAKTEGDVKVVKKTGQSIHRTPKQSVAQNNIHIDHSYKHPDVEKAKIIRIKNEPRVKQKLDSDEDKDGLINQKRSNTAPDVKVVRKQPETNARSYIYRRDAEKAEQTLYVKQSSNDTVPKAVDEPTNAIKIRDKHDDESENKVVKPPNVSVKQVKVIRVKSSTIKRKEHSELTESETIKNKQINQDSKVVKVSNIDKRFNYERKKVYNDEENKESGYPYSNTSGKSTEVKSRHMLDTRSNEKDNGITRLNDNLKVGELLSSSQSPRLSVGMAAHEASPSHKPEGNKNCVMKNKVLKEMVDRSDPTANTALSRMPLPGIDGAKERKLKKSSSNNKGFSSPSDVNVTHLGKNAHEHVSLAPTSQQKKGTDSNSQGIAENKSKDHNMRLSSVRTNEQNKENSKMKVSTEELQRQTEKQQKTNTSVSKAQIQEMEAKKIQTDINKTKNNDAVHTNKKVNKLNNNKVPKKPDNGDNNKQDIGTIEMDSHTADVSAKTGEGTKQSTKPLFVRTSKIDRIPDISDINDINIPKLDTSVRFKSENIKRSLLEVGDSTSVRALEIRPVSGKPGFTRVHAQKIVSGQSYNNIHKEKTYIKPPETDSKYNSYSYRALQMKVVKVPIPTENDDTLLNFKGKGNPTKKRTESKCPKVKAPIVVRVKTEQSDKLKKKDTEKKNVPSSKSSRNSTSVKVVRVPADPDNIKQVMDKESGDKVDEKKTLKKKKEVKQPDDVVDPPDSFRDNKASKLRQKITFDDVATNDATSRKLPRYLKNVKSRYKVIKVFAGGLIEKREREAVEKKKMNEVIRMMKPRLRKTGKTETNVESNNKPEEPIETIVETNKKFKAKWQKALAFVLPSDPHNMQATKVDAIDIQTNDDRNNCWISAIMLWSTTVLVVLDPNNICIKIVDCLEKKVTSRLIVKGRPWDLAKTSNGNIYVTIPQSQFIRCIGYEENSLKAKPAEDVRVSGECHGIVCYFDMLIVSYTTGPSRLEMLTMSGTVLRVIATSVIGDLFLMSPEHIAISHSDVTTLIYVTDFKSDVIGSMSIDGTVLSMYKHESLRSPRGIVSDVKENIYVCSWHDDTIHMLTPKFEKVKIILDKDSKISRVCAITYCPKEHKLYVGSKSQIRIFRLGKTT